MIENQGLVLLPFSARLEPGCVRPIGDHHARLSVELLGFALASIIAWRLLTLDRKSAPRACDVRGSGGVWGSFMPRHPLAFANRSTTNAEATSICRRVCLSRNQSRRHTDAAVHMRPRLYRGATAAIRHQTGVSLAYPTPRLLYHAQPLASHYLASERQRKCRGFCNLSRHARTAMARDSLDDRLLVPSTKAATRRSRFRLRITS